MEKITVLSPHRDDAGFSLGLSLSFWGAASIKLQVLNFFTQSAYAPRSSAKTTKEVSVIREEEDRKALVSIHKEIIITSLSLLDAPLRLSIPLSQITQEETAGRITQTELSRLSDCIQQHCAESLAIAPLGLGNHVDHIAVHKAALDSLPPRRLAFYEDLPYATWTPDADLQARIESVEQANGIPLKPFIVQAQDAERRKRQIANFYQSQITAEEADSIAQYAETYGSGERLWMPADSEGWEAIKLLATTSPQRAIPDPSR